MLFDKKRIKRFDCRDMCLIKLSIAAFVLFILKIWPAAMNFTHNTNIWWFIAATIVFALRPLIRAYKK